MIEKEEPANIIPHRGKMLLLSRIKGYDLEERTLSAECDITENCLFYDPVNGGVPSWVAFEFIAQAISALSGIWTRKMGEKPKIGFILSISSMKSLISFFKAGSTVEIKVKESGRMDLVYNFDGEAHINGKKVLEGKITVMDETDEQVKSIIEEQG